MRFLNKITPDTHCQIYMSSTRQDCQARGSSGYRTRHWSTPFANLPLAVWRACSPIRTTRGRGIKRRQACSTKKNTSTTRRKLSRRESTLRTVRATQQGGPCRRATLSTWKSKNAERLFKKPSDQGSVYPAPVIGSLVMRAYLRKPF